MKNLQLHQYDLILTVLCRSEYAIFFLNTETLPFVVRQDWSQ